ncbi:MAG TPA: LAGLIDADG family homing endonuclease [Candidatus Bathyarchaeia archaeon]|nr:LAGLIDADG family homing endonuclease [Candidatus Bathyarchaeia archaeon]
MDEFVEPYSTWEQVAGYFDGDGSVSIFIGKFTIAFYLDWADQSKDQLVQVTEFLRRQGIHTGDPRKMSNSAAYSLRIADQDSVVKVAELIAPYCHKKRKELLTLLEYRKHDLISATEVQRRFQRFVELGIRERHGRRPFRDMPWSYSVGYHLSRKNIWLLSHRPRLILSEAQKREALQRHKVFGESISALSLFYGISRSAMGRLLKHG